MPVLPTLSTTSCECAREALSFYQFHFPCSAATDAGTLKTAGIGGAKHCIFHVRIEGENGLPDTVDFAVASPDVVRHWVDGLSSLLHIGSVGIGLQIKQPGGRFIVVGAIKDSPAAASGLFCSGDVIEAIDTMALTPSTAFSVFEALLLGLDNTPVSLSVDRRGQKVPSPFFSLPLAFYAISHALSAAASHAASDAPQAAPGRGCFCRVGREIPPVAC
jgi:hypothetical protein